MKTSIAAFYWVAQAQDNPAQSAFHVDVVDVAETMEEVAEIGGATRMRQLNVAQAESEGLSLAAIGKAFCNATAVQVAAQTEQLDILYARLDAQALAHKAAIETMEQGKSAERAAMKAGHDEALAAQAKAFETDLERIKAERVDETGRLVAEVEGLRAEIRALKTAPASAGEQTD